MKRKPRSTDHQPLLAGFDSPLEPTGDAPAMPPSDGASGSTQIRTESQEASALSESDGAAEPVSPAPPADAPSVAAVDASAEAGPISEAAVGVDNRGDETAEAASLPLDLSGQTVYVVDAHSLIYQVFHALPEMTSPTGQPVAAVHGFLRDLIDLLEKRQPDYLLCAFDHPGDNFRHELYTEYKANRESMPDDLRTQIPMIHRLLEPLGIPDLSIPNFEADDILATLARQVERAGGECILVTGDKDCRQLISDKVRLFNIRKGEFFDAAALQATWGIRPEQVVDFQTLVGDAVDHIPGVPLIGPKLAQELLTRFETLDNLFDHAQEVSGTKRRENLINGRAQALVSRELVRLRDDVPVSINWRTARVGRVDAERIQQLCGELGFRRLAERLVAFARRVTAQRGGGAADASNALASLVPATGGGLSGDADSLAAAQAAQAADAQRAADRAAQAAEFRRNYRTVATRAALSELVERLRQCSVLSVDTETTSPRPRWAELVGISLAWETGEACYIPLRAPAGEPQLPWEEVREILRPVLENPAIGKVGQNIKYDLIVLRQSGVSLAGIIFDTMVADYLLEPGTRTHNLDDLADRHLGHETIRIDALIGSGRSAKQMDEVPVPLITEYAAEDADVAFRLTPLLRARLEQDGLTSLFGDLELPLIEVLAELEYNGIRVDVEVLERLRSRYASRLESLEQEIHALAGVPFNIDSPSQLAEVLFGKLQLPVVKKTKTGASTDAEVLEELAPRHPLPAKMLEYRQLAKLQSTYIDALPQLVHPGTGRVHSSFKQDVAATGRLSSTDPNLQNIPIRTEAGREIRGAFRAGEPGWVLVSADYSQIELRVLAHFSGDAALQRAFADDEDVHTRVASEVYGVPLDAVTREMRRSAKAINFGVIYGQSPFGLAKSLGIAKDEAARFIDAYFAGYPGVDGFMEKVLAEAAERGYVTTILGRRRAVQGVRTRTQRGDSRQRNLPERIAINTVIQGSAADLIKRAMVNIHRRLRDESWPARMLLQIHDELVFEVEASACARLSEMVVAEMTAARLLDVPLKVDVAHGATWAECDDS